MIGSNWGIEKTATNIAKTTLEKEDDSEFMNEDQEQLRSHEGCKEDTSGSREHLGRILLDQEESGKVPDRHLTEVECLAPIGGGTPPLNNPHPP